MKTRVDEFLEGVVDEVVYTNPETGYTVCVLDCAGEPVTLVGTMPFLGEGETVKVHGNWTVHPTFGRQFRVDSFEKKLPDSADAIYRYLASGALRGVGPVLAERLIHRFGAEALDVIEHHPRWLCEIRGISPKKADELHEAFTQQFGLRSVMLAFGDFFGPTLCVRIFKHYGAAAVDLIRQNPYRLCTEIDGIGFRSADRLAQSLGVAPDAEERLQAGICSMLDSAAFQNGHCRVPEDLLCAQTAKTLEVPEPAVRGALSALSEEKVLIRTEEDGTVFYASQALYTAERYIAAKLVLLAGEKRPFTPAGIPGRIDALEREGGITYAEEQRQAITYAVTEGVTVVTGGPGTGKTTVIKAILQLFDDLKLDCMLAAPTGRAAKRMSEASGREAKTIHRLLETGFTEDRQTHFQRGEDNPLPCKALIIDEMSMVDTLLLEALLRAVKPGTFVVFIGDVDQLPSVGPGNCLANLIDSGRFAVVRLHHIFRQAEKSLIIRNAHRINRGEMPLLSVRDSDFFFLERHGADAVRDTLLQLCAVRLPKRYGVDPFEDIQIICWTRKGPLGTAELNAALQETLNPPAPGKREKRAGSRVFREGDKVMQIRNNYDLLWRRANDAGNRVDGAGVFNGDIGRIRRIDPQGEALLIDFDDRVCAYDFSLLDDLELAYAITTHKSQGSEYRFVLIPAFEAAYPLMTRNLLYTAVTRAREMVCAVGDPKTFAVMVGNDRKPVRFTALPGILQQV